MHDVVLTRPFMIGQCRVTYGQLLALGINKGNKDLEYPVAAIEPDVASEYCRRMTEKYGRFPPKVYLCLFSASWCGPCRREMPRIAKIYTETLKSNPDIELIQFSWDKDETKALAWAKEYDVKFPVVKYNGGNPLNLRPRGIPHLFIVKADGTLLERGHPMKLFTEEKLRELK